ncbi:hypothetical protein [Dinghuibacter silviterrae]|uniref:PAS domain-containing protein n=1 Tax=Dinghuibacter silviterrae TaxID=1539049 RepID=A0A4R8DQY2_9BACT|nr:hypothetical protein [Dinghuibacter silviterrae]TDX00562.1 hypothetical protein EDB95_1587 [Dinghuibacter silviterrae]
MPMYNTYSFTKSDFAAMLQHIVDLIPDWMFLYDPAEDLVVYHNCKHGWMFRAGAPPPGDVPIRLRELLEPIVVPQDWSILENNARELQQMSGSGVREVRFRLLAQDMIPRYRWCSFRQKVFWQDEGGGVKLILCISSEIRSTLADPLCYS